MTQRNTSCQLIIEPLKKEKKKCIRLLNCSVFDHRLTFNGITTINPYILPSTHVHLFLPNKYLFYYSSITSLSFSCFLWMFDLSLQLVKVKQIVLVGHAPDFKIFLILIQIFENHLFVTVVSDVLNPSFINLYLPMCRPSYE